MIQLYFILISFQSSHTAEQLSNRASNTCSRSLHGDFINDESTLLTGLEPQPKPGFLTPPKRDQRPHAVDMIYTSLTRNI